MDNSDKKSTNESNADLDSLVERYYQERLKFYPIEATYIGDNRYNDQLQIDITDSFRNSVKIFYSSYLEQIKKFNRDELNDNDRISYDVFRHEMEISIEGYKFPDHYIPFQQFWSLPLTLGQLGSGTGSQPFKTTEDYQHWIKRASRFPAWADAAIENFKKGIDAGIVLPTSLVVKMIPQMEALASTDSSNIFFGPTKIFPATFTSEQKDSLKKQYDHLVKNVLAPSYRKLADFLNNEYRSKSRSTSGISSVPGGTEYYSYVSRYYTTTSKTPDEIYNLGMNEVKRIRSEMEKTKNEVGFQGNLEAFFEHLRTDKKFYPFKTAEEVLNAFRAIQSRIMPHMITFSNLVPKTPFEIRQTEAYRAASASAEYMQGTPDGSRPGIFYVPILDATKFNLTSGMESLFLHEAIPGHHYQISLQQENDSLPSFRRFGGNGAYVEGWALYTESLGKELGLYSDPYQYMGALGDEIHRAIRLVVDVGLHVKGWTREQAIAYMMENEAINEDGAVAEIERYMAIPGQALSYKIGSLKIAELRKKYEGKLGSKFSVAAFHDEILKDGPMPLEVLERKMDSWAEKR